MSEQSCHPSTSVCNQLRLEGVLCDAVLRVDDVDFHVHKVLLCQITPYFRALFTRWSDASQGAYTIPGLSPEIMHHLLQFAYTGHVPVTEDNVQELIMAADQLNVTAVVEICCDFLLERLHPENCIGFWQFTSAILVPPLRHSALRCILDHFEEVLNGHELLQLTAEELAEILGHDDLNVRVESTAYEAVIQWISCMPAERQQHIAALLSKVRLTLMSAAYIRTNVQSCYLIKNNPECQTMVREALGAINDFQEATADLLYNPFFRPRLPNAVLLATGGWSGGDPTNSIEAYDYQTNSWVDVQTSEPPRAYHGTAFLDGFVYFVGGFDRHEYFNTVRRFDPLRHEWKEVAPMHNRRCYVSVTVLNGCIFALGGYDGQLRLRTAEFYWPQTNQWSLIAPMHARRSDASCATLNNKIYICGGFTGHDCLQTAECYDPETNEWTLISQMNSCRSGVGVVAYADQIYAVGGFDGNNRLHCAEAYNPYTDTWEYVSSMVTARSNFGIEVLDDRIFVVGGFNGVNTTNNSEYYDLVLNEWISIRNMQVLRSALSCCVISGLPNLDQYAAPRNMLPPVRFRDPDGDEAEEEEEASSPLIPDNNI